MFRAFVQKKLKTRVFLMTDNRSNDVPCTKLYGIWTLSLWRIID